MGTQHKDGDGIDRNQTLRCISLSLPCSYLCFSVSEIDSRILEEMGQTPAVTFSI